MKIQLISLLALGFFLASCAGTKPSLGPDHNPDPEVEFRQLDTLTISVSKSDPVFVLEKYSPSYTRKHDLLHTNLDVRFDWGKQHLLGVALLDLKPHFYPMDEVVLDAKGFDIHSVEMVTDDKKKPLEYNYDGKKLKILLGKAYTAGETYRLRIDYTAKPNELEAGGSAAITSDKGLYFVNPLGEEKDKPMQIWTQGETEASSCWFPTLDMPNERCTQEIRITVEDKFKTLSNGVKKSSKKNSDGTRTDYFVLDQPHAPYLFMMAIGEYAIVKDKWEDIPLEYWVEPEYKDVAAEIFTYTPEMLDFFSTILGVKYPWPTYNQVIVRDYVSGAMENTTAVIYGEPVQKDARELIDNSNEGIVAHETIHQWFGNYVTCESWSNIPLNEAFANYGEYLWFEFKHGRDQAEFLRMSELAGYFSQARRNIHDLIWFDFDDKEQVFDSHSYNKGGCTLHMLRDYVGDNAFFASLNKYLVDNAYTDVEAHELRLAFEDITGEDLNWFFNQWFYSAGHPILEVTDNFDPATGVFEINVSQKQNPEKSPPIFLLPMTMVISTSKGDTEVPILINQRKQTFSFETGEKPLWYTLDKKRVQIAEINYPGRTNSEYVQQYFHSSELIDRYEALQFLAGKEGEGVEKMMTDALDDPFWAIRRLALRTMRGREIAKIAIMAVSDPRSQVRSAALEALGDSGNKQYIPTIKKAIDTELAYRTVASGLIALNELDPAEALSYAKKMENETNPSLISKIGEIYSVSKDIQHLSFFEKSWSKLSGFSTIGFLEDYVSLVLVASADRIEQSTQKLFDLATDMNQNGFRRYSATKSIHEIRQEFEKRAADASSDDEKMAYESRAANLKKMIEEIKKKETSGRLKEFYSRF